MLASIMYAGDHDDTFPGNELLETTPDGLVNGRATWAKELYPYVSDKWSVYACPAAAELDRAGRGVVTSAIDGRPAGDKLQDHGLLQLSEVLGSFAARVNRDVLGAEFKQYMVCEISQWNTA